MNLAEWLYASARRVPLAEALFLGTECQGRYCDFADRAARIGRALAAHHGVAPGDRVAIFLKNCPDFLELLFGIWWCGGVAVPINAKLHPREVAYMLGHSGARLIVSDTGDIAARGSADTPEIAMGTAAWTAMLNGPSPEGRPLARAADDLAWLFYTSGTTGQPKGVMLSHGNLRAMCYAFALDVESVTEAHSVLYPAPMSHGGGLYALPYIRAGARHVCPVSRGFDPGEIADLAQHFGNAVYFAAPTMIRRQIEAAEASGYRGEGIASVIYGGGPMYGRDIDAALARFGPRFAQIYGQGESPMTITMMTRAMVADESHPNWRARRDSVGIAQANVDVRVVDDAFANLPPGTPGEIVVRGDPVMRGYWNDAQATAKTIRDGWLRTGDIGRMDEDGFLTLTDRAKDVIISGGTNIYPREVEEVLLRHPGIDEVAVIGVPDAEWGERVKACVVPVEGADLDVPALEDWCRAEMASFKKPSVWTFCESLPKNAYGKVLKRELR